MYLVVFLVPLLHLCLRRDAPYIDDIHYALVSMLWCWLRRSDRLLTVIGCDQLMSPVVWLAALKCLLAAVRPLRQVVGLVHPTHSRKHLMFIGRADFQDPGNPVDLRLLPVLHGLAIVHRLLLLDTRLVCDGDEVFVSKSGPTNCVR